MKVIITGSHFTIILENFQINTPNVNQQGGLSSRHELPLTPIFDIEPFYVWGIDFIWLFICSFENKCILEDGIMPPNV